MNEVENDLGSEYYGHGSWRAPYWFIGPEPGQSLSENNDLKLRHHAFRHLGEDGLTDCGAFHEFIGETRWHRPLRPALQPTWSRLILLLMTFLEKPADNESLRVYQREYWGRIGGETCVVELSGLAARDSGIPRDRKKFRESRIEGIRYRMKTHRPALVVMYGIGAKQHWERIVNLPLDPGCVKTADSTILAFAAHPVARGQKKEYWMDLGLRMRAMR